MIVYTGRKKKPIHIDRESLALLDGGCLSVTSHGYAVIIKYFGKVGGKYKYKREYLHRAIMKAPKHLEVDHINGNKLDNRRANLRLCRRSSNARNTSSKSGIKGVHQNKRGKWIAQITKNYKCYHLGTFNNIETASAAYNKAAKKLHGKYARLN